MRNRHSLLLAGTSMLMISSCSNGASSSAEKFNTAVYNGDSGGALNHFDPDLKQIAGMKMISAINAASAKAKSHGGVKSVETSDSKIDGDRGTVTVKETFGDGSVTTEVDKVRKVGGEWYVTM